MGCSGGDPAARQSGESPRQTAANRSVRTAGTGSKTGGARIPPTQTADRPALYLARLQQGRDPGLREFPYGPRRLDEIHFRSQGIPRLINAIFDNLLLTAFAMESKVATMEMLDEVTGDLRLEYPGKNPFRPDSNYPEQVLRRPDVRFRAD